MELLLWDVGCVGEVIASGRGAGKAVGDVTVGGICNPVVKMVGMTCFGVAISPIFGIVVMIWLVSRCGGLDGETVLAGTATSSLNLLFGAPFVD